MTEHYYWCPVLETWVLCTEAKYQAKYFGRSFTRIVETN